LVIVLMMVLVMALAGCERPRQAKKVEFFDPAIDAPPALLDAAAEPTLLEDQSTVKGGYTAPGE